jgi:hypothetical protein
MSSDQIAEIAPGIREALADARYCATFEIAGQAHKWVQFQAGTVNAAYPHSEHPANLLTTIGGGALTEWTAGKFLTVNLAFNDARAVAKWIDGYFERVLAAGDDYAVDLRIEVI